MTVCTFVIDYIDVDIDILVPVYCRGEFIYIKTSDFPSKLADEFSDFERLYKVVHPTPPWEDGNVCSSPQNLISFAHGRYLGELARREKVMIRRVDELCRDF